MDDIQKRVVSLKDVKKDDIVIAGGKGANLGELFSLGLPVPPGFVVTAQTYKEFIEYTKIRQKINFLLEQIVDYQNTELLQTKANEIQKLIVTTDVPSHIRKSIIEAYEAMDPEAALAAKVENLQTSKKQPFVAVRSSATAEDLPEASFAGQQATYLNIRGNENVVQAVKACWASLFTARAIYYRHDHKFAHDKVYIAVVVQKMVNSEMAGVMFTVNPATKDMTEVVIEAGYGLGEAVVAGLVNPDRYIVDRKSFAIKEAIVKKQEWGLFRDSEKGQNVKMPIPEEAQERRILNDAQVIALAKLGLKVENHFGKPQDIEWAVEKNNLFLTQSRAVTTLKKEEPKETQKEEPKEEKPPEPAPEKPVEEKPLEKPPEEKPPEEKPVEEKPSEEPKEDKPPAVIITGETASPGIACGPVKIVYNPGELKKIQDGDVLVTKMTTPDMVPAMQKACAIVTNEGGMTCHAAIVSREMGIPCIVGTQQGTKAMVEGEIVTVNADKGIVYEGRMEIPEKPKEVKQEAPKTTQPAPNVETMTKVKVIMDLPNFAEHAAQTGADGVGLCRIEVMTAVQRIHPAEYIRRNEDQHYTNLIYDGVKQIADAFKGKPVWVRTSDMRTDEYRNLEGGDKDPDEDNPMMGWHGIRRSVDDTKMLSAEFAAIKRLHDEGYNNVGIMIPFIINVEEIKKAKQVMRNIGLEPVKDIAFGVMCETPAACWIIESICKEGVSFVSFGSNDLTQLTLGVDRNNENISKLFDEMHPAVLAEIEHVVRTCKKYNIQTSICGQAGSRPEMAEFLVKVGIDSISANTDAVANIRKKVAETERAIILEYQRSKMGSSLSK